MLHYWQNDPVITEITALDIERVLNDLPGKTANRCRRELNTLWIYAMKRGIANENPVKVIDKYKEKQFRKYVPPSEDVQAVMRVATPLEYDILTFAYHTLARSGEIRRCKWYDVDFEKRCITLWTSKRKGGSKEDDTLDMTDTLFNMLAARPKNHKYVFTRDGKPITKAWLDSVMPRVCKKADVKPFSMHGIRHHVAALLTYKLSLAQISKILRHKRMTTTDIYLRSIVKIETKGIKVLDDMNKPTGDNVVPFIRAAK